MTGNARATLFGSLEEMKHLSNPLGIGVLAVLLSAELPAQDQKKSTEVQTTAGKFSLEVTAEYLGMASGKTVVRLRLSSPQLSKALSARGVRFASGELRGSFSRGADMVEAFRYPGQRGHRRGEGVCVLLPARGPARRVQGQARLRACPAARTSARERSTSAVPEVGMSSARTWRRRGGTLPEAEAIVIADEGGRGKPPATRSSKLKILPPSREAPVGLLRLDAEVEPPITRVEFYLARSSWRAPAALLGRDRPREPAAQADRARRGLRRQRAPDRRRRVGDQRGQRRASRCGSCRSPTCRPARCASAWRSSRSRAAWRSRSSSSWTRRRSARGRRSPYVATIPFDQYTRGTYIRRDGHLRGRQGSERHQDAARDLHVGRERARGRRPAPRLGAGQGLAFRQGPDAETTSRSRKTAAPRR